MSITIRRAYGIGQYGKEVTIGWDVFVDGQWHDRFRTREQARSCAKELSSER